MAKPIFCPRCQSRTERRGAWRMCLAPDCRYAAYRARTSTLRCMTGGYADLPRPAGETNDCGPRALACAAAVSYDVAYAACKKAGRQIARGMSYRALRLDV